MVLMAAIVAVGLVPGADALSENEKISIWQVKVDGPDDVATLVNGGYDLVEGRGADYLLVVGNDALGAELAALGFQVERDQALPLIPGVQRTIDAGGEITGAANSYYGGYRTVEEHYQHLDQVVADHPNLTTLYDYGDSWLKTEGRANPNELKVICITNKQAGDCQLDPNSAKPRAVIMAAIHARELQTSEIAWRLIDELTDNYATDADIAHMLDTTEVWIIPVANPDGREIVESGGNSPYLQRKNANDDLGNCEDPPTSSNQYGVDLNRNASTYNYGGVGTSTSPCSQTYRGTGAASEPEQAFLEALFRDLWPDQKGAPGDAVASTATGTFISMHSFSELILLPPGAGGLTPNDTELRKLAFRMSHYNGYTTGTGPEILYGVTGATDDWAHYELGVAGFTYELSPAGGSCGGFTPPYSCIDSSLWPLNRDALLYSIKVAGAPYVTPQGPTTLSVTAGSGTVERGEALALSAVIDDNAYGENGRSRPSPVNVTEAQYQLDVAPSAGGAPVAMTAEDGAFNETGETAVAAVDTSGLSLGQHTVYVRARNSGGFWGPVTAASFTVTAPVDDPPVADDQSVSTPVDSPVAITLTATDPEGQPVSYAVTGGPANGTLSGSAPNLTYTPDGGFRGPDSFTFTATDGTNTSTEATVSISVGVPVGPVFSDDFETDQGWQANPDGTDTATTGRWERANPAATSFDGPKQLGTTTSGSNDLVTGAVAGTAVGFNDVDNGPTSIRSPEIILPPGAELELSFDWYFAHTPNSSTADFLRVTVEGANDRVVLVERGDGTDRDATWTRATADISDYAGQTITVLVEAADGAGGSIVEAGVDTLVIESLGATGGPPVADDQSVTVDQDDSVAITLTGSDPDGDQLTFAVTGGPSNGALSGTAPNLTYTPNSGYSGSDSFTFVANDGTSDSAPATVSITVSAVGGVVYSDDFETAGGWSRNPFGSDRARRGIWQIANPEQTRSSGQIMQPGDAAGGQQALVTGYLAGSSVGSYDIDRGTTTMRSPTITLPSATLTLSLDYYLAHRPNSSSADFLRISVVGASGSEVVFEERGAADFDAGVWESLNVDISDFAGEDVYLLIAASDSSNGSLVEAGIDNVIIESS
jgi:hypothetical protein